MKNLMLPHWLVLLLDLVTRLDKQRTVGNNDNWTQPSVCCLSRQGLYVVNKHAGLKPPHAALH